MTRRRIPVLLILLTVLAGCAGGKVEPPLTETRLAHEQRAAARFDTGDLTQAAASFGHAARLAEMSGDHAAAIRNLIGLGTSYLQLDALAAAQRALEDARELARREGATAQEQQALLGLANVAYRRGDTDAAAALYRAVLNALDKPPAAETRLAALNGLMLCALARGDLSQAERHLHAAEALLPDLGSGQRAATLHNRATLSLRLGRLEQAHVAATEALALDRAQGDPAAIAADLELLGWIRDRRGDEAGAALHLRQAGRLYRHLGMSAAADRIAAYLDHNANQKGVGDK